VSKELKVDHDFWSPFVGNDKHGVLYCQFIAPGYVQRLAKGEVAPPVCDPVYKPAWLPILPPQQPKTWKCPL